MDHSPTLDVVMEQLVSLYSLNSSETAAVFDEICQYDETRLSDVLRKLDEFRGWQIQAVDTFVRKDLSEKHETVEKREKEDLEMAFVY